MSRELQMDSLVPGLGKDDIPYPDASKTVKQINKNVPEVFAGEVVGAGGAGGTLDLPFDPGYIEVTNPENAPRVRKVFCGPGDGTVREQTDSTGAPATGVTLAADGDGKFRRVTLDVATVADAETAQIIAYGFRDGAGGSSSL